MRKLTFAAIFVVAWFDLGWAGPCCTVGHHDSGCFRVVGASIRHVRTNDPNHLFVVQQGGRDSGC